MEGELKPIERRDVVPEHRANVREELCVRRGARDARRRRAGEQRGADRGAGECECAADPIGGPERRRRRSSPGRGDGRAFGERDEEREDRCGTHDAPRNDSREPDRHGSAAATLPIALRADEPMAAHDSVARGLRVSAEPAVSDQPADEAAVITGSELRPGQSRRESGLVRDEPLEDGTGPVVGLAKFRLSGARFAPRGHSNRPSVDTRTGRVNMFDARRPRFPLRPVLGSLAARRGGQGLEPARVSAKPTLDGPEHGETIRVSTGPISVSTRRRSRCPRVGDLGVHARPIRALSGVRTRPRSGCVG